MDDYIVKQTAKDEDLLLYGPARRQIYMPAFHWVLENVTAVRALLKELAGIAAERKVVLLDYYTNGDVNDETTPLSHAALIKEYLEKHASELLAPSR